VSEQERDRMAAERALFVFIGAEANTGWLQGAVELDERGFVLTGRELDGSVVEGNVWEGLSRLAVPLGGEHGGGICGRRHAQWLDQAGRLRSGGGLYGGEVGPPVPGRCRRAKSVRILPSPPLSTSPIGLSVSLL
jgi:hypothetical protein